MTYNATAANEFLTNILLVLSLKTKKKGKLETRLEHQAANNFSFWKEHACDGQTAAVGNVIFSITPHWNMVAKINENGASA